MNASKNPKVSFWVAIFSKQTTTPTKIPTIGIHRTSKSICHPVSRVQCIDESSTVVPLYIYILLFALYHSLQKQNDNDIYDGKEHGSGGHWNGLDDAFRIDVDVDHDGTRLPIATTSTPATIPPSLSSNTVLLDATTHSFIGIIIDIDTIAVREYTFVIIALVVLVRSRTLPTGHCRRGGGPIHVLPERNVDSRIESSPGVVRSITPTESSVLQYRDHRGVVEQ